MKDEQPLVTVNILSFNRKDELRNTLQKVFEQDYKNIEVIVVDNASSDGSSDMVKVEFPSVKLINLKKNIGIAGWNEGFKVAKGEYVLVLDDDAYPEKQTITHMVQKFNTNSTVGALAFNIFNFMERENKLIRYNGNWLPIESVDTCEWMLIVGCSFGIRKNLFIENLFSPDFFICFHELPIIHHVLNSGFKIHYDQNLKSTHVLKSYGDYNRKRDYFHYRNMLNFLFWSFPIPNNFILVFRVMLFYLTRALRHNWFINYLIACFSIRKKMLPTEFERLNNSNANAIVKTGIIDYKFLKKFKAIH